MRPRIRTIKPETWADEHVGDLSHSARLLWVGLITMADDEGRLRELPAAIIGHVFPHDDISRPRLNRWLAEVEHSGMIIRYEIADRRYIAFRHWARHQKVDRPNESELPPPPSPNDRRMIDEEASKEHRMDHEASIPTRDRASDRAVGLVLSDPDPDPLLKTTEVSENQAERADFDYWRQKCKHPNAKFTPDRRAKLRARRREGYTDEQIRQAIDGAARAAYVSDAGKRFDDLELICRSGSKLESFIDRPNGNGRGPVKENASSMLRDLWPEHDEQIIDAEVVEGDTKHES